MKRMKKHLSVIGTAIIGRMLFIGFSVQIALGLCWMLCNFGARQNFALQSMRSDGFLYPVLLGIAPHYCVVYLLQAAVALWAGYVFLKSIRPSLFWNIWGSLVIFTVPMGMQCHLALLPDSLISSLMLMECGLFWKAAKKHGTVLFAEMAACWLCLAFLDETYLFLGGILPFLLLLVTVCGRERFRLIPLILLFCAFAGIICGAYDLARMTGGYKGEPKRVSEMLCKRFVWSTVLKEWGDWPPELTACVEGSVIMNASFYSDGFEMELKPALSAVLSQEEMDALFVDLAKKAWSAYPKRITLECGWDLAGYVFSPTVTGLMLEGRGYMSYCLRNYDIMSREAPKLTKYYMNYGCYWFGIAFLLAAFVEIVSGFYADRAASKRKWGCLAAYAVTCGCVALWYTAQGAGMMDYKRTVFITGLWLIWQIQKTQTAAGYVNDGTEREKRV
ncbi:MAG: hypothetical protein NC251_05150 [Lachnoclostridium sp.]|nr:hypothetical protein [Lachnospira sp.]MCM1247800.1 hypothetical protein [Lachnoclostridium sp.]MCM1534334.1 hypothetical protein [Clostridium sp.]